MRRSKSTEKDPFSTPARRRRIIADLAKNVLRVYYLSAAQNVCRFRYERKSAIKLQCRVRQFLAKKRVLYLIYWKQVISVTIIQCTWRVYSAKRKLKNLRNNLWRKRALNLVSAMEDLWYIRKAKLHKLAIKISKQLILEKKRNRAATKIQTIFRRHSVQKILKHHQYNRKLMQYKLFTSAIMTQKHFRRYLQRKKYLCLIRKRQLAVYTIISSLSRWKYKMRKHRKLFQNAEYAKKLQLERFSATKIQSWFRMKLAKVFLVALKPIIQSSVQKIEIEIQLAYSVIRMFQQQEIQQFFRWILQHGIVSFNLSKGFHIGSVIEQVLFAVKNLQHQHQRQQQQSRPQTTASKSRNSERETKTETESETEKVFHTTAVEPTEVNDSLLVSHGREAIIKVQEWNYSSANAISPLLGEEGKSPRSSSSTNIPFPDQWMTSVQHPLHIGDTIQCGIDPDDEYSLKILLTSPVISSSEIMTYVQPILPLGGRDKTPSISKSYPKKKIIHNNTIVEITICPSSIPLEGEEENLTYGDTEKVANQALNDAVFRVHNTIIYVPQTFDNSDENEEKIQEIIIPVEEEAISVSVMIESPAQSTNLLTDTCSLLPLPAVIESTPTLILSSPPKPPASTINFDVHAMKIQVIINKLYNKRLFVFLLIHLTMK
jgi:hypothetical protein